ncbi:hypothetical protein BCR37DRAFT_1155 [Protomyces lactucae-debilis]|uniref:HMG box domain-containing protein n=1 Tax=Protomyces lactucae-debilis TaxID=2754530 RepID=A0A1Y2FVI3_PROLT|nr:uncharacterized protein BCR37DRAFT_1155 [Protomyces lactucae-debilis]ORY87577.1 hypothetical protein BCR37DRAFT_1155 [Protomyces lactucae-debilis]
MKREVAIGLEQLGLSQYIARLEQEGFDEWASLCDITESDLEALDIKRGHRRILLRHIATIRGHPSTEPLDDGSSDGTGHPEDGTRSRSNSISTRRPSLAFTDAEDSQCQRMMPTKRQYKRHPKVDENAPSRPPSAYVMFANQIREEQRQSKLTFTQIARLAGERWKNLGPAEKVKIEAAADALKQKYVAETNEYRKSVEYQLYQDYLSEFKERAVRHEKPEKLVAPKRTGRNGVPPRHPYSPSAHPSTSPQEAHSTFSRQSSSCDSSSHGQSPAFVMTSTTETRPSEEQKTPLPHLNQWLPSMQEMAEQAVPQHLTGRPPFEQHRLPPLKMSMASQEALPPLIPSAYRGHGVSDPSFFRMAGMDRTY